MEIENFLGTFEKEKCSCGREHVLAVGNIIIECMR